MKSDATNELLHQLIKCITACETCAATCVREGSDGKVDCINNDRDCADICSLLTHYLGRNSRHSSRLIKMCIDIIRECEKECRKHDDDHCQKCAEVCHNTHKILEQYQEN